ncbi:MAG: ATP-binding protein [Gammaproteobacteria bacterium]
MDDSRNQRIGDGGIEAPPVRGGSDEAPRLHAADILQGFWAFAPDALLATDASGRIALVNSRTETLFGYPRGELIGLSVESLMPERFRGGHMLMRDHFVRDGRPRAMESGLSLWGRRKDGSEFPLEISLSHFRSGDEPIVLAAIRDISEKHRRDEEVTAAREAAEAASAAKSQFLATMSHEIRTPMNSVIGLLHLLQVTPLEPKQVDYLKKIEQAANSLLSIINDILDFSKADAGKLAVDSVPFELEQVIETVSNLSSTRAHRKDLEFSVHIAPDVPHSLLGDPLRLTQILSNVCSNAVKFTEYGEVLLSVSLEQRSADAVTLHFLVRDTGIGIDPAQIESIFEPFRQADSSTTRKYGGTGLGLAICKRLADLMEGRIWAESEPGKGSSFHLTLDFPAGQALSGRSHGSSAHPTPDLQGLEVLLADDSATTLGILT